MSDADSNELGPFTANSETSRRAALDNYPRSGSQRHRVLIEIAGLSSRFGGAVITGHGRPGRTRDELADYLSLPDSSADARAWELKQGGYIEETEETRYTRAGSAAKVLRVTQKGLDEIKKNEEE